MSSERTNTFLDLVVNHSKKVSLFASMITSVVFGLRVGHTHPQIQVVVFDQVVVYDLLSLLISVVGTAIFYYALIHFVDYLRHLSSNSSLANRAIIKVGLPVLFLYLLDAFVTKVSIGFYIELGVNPIFVWSFHVYCIIFLSSVVVRAYVHEKIKDAKAS